MDQNSPKPDGNRNDRLLALDLALEWVQFAGRKTKSGAWLWSIFETTKTALARDETAPEIDSGTLAAIWLGERKGNYGHESSLKNPALENWWASREQALIQLCQDRDCPVIPTLIVTSGGGRGNQNSYRVEFRSTPQLDPEQSDDLPKEDRKETMTYRVDPARPSFLVRAFLGSKPFVINSWRGYLLIGSAVFNFFVIGLVWLCLILMWSQATSITTGTLSALLSAVTLTAGLWWQATPIRKLPTDRVSLANGGFLAMNELYGQLRTMPEEHGNPRVFSIVRHWGTCPICEAEVDLDSGRKAFPDRLVGRCHDAPLEHVFSFDPVTLKGERLRQA